ncbi:MAG: hypothetical protein AABY88_04470, partial [Pseudomonadota bacterium]
QPKAGVKYQISWVNVRYVERPLAVYTPYVHLCELLARQQSTESIRSMENSVCSDQLFRAIPVSVITI